MEYIAFSQMHENICINSVSHSFGENYKEWLNKYVI
jgi:hypothetical protein